MTLFACLFLTNKEVIIIITFLFGDCLKSNVRQFGFKKNMVCMHAVLLWKKNLFFVSNESTVNKCFLDISKAFDRLNHRPNCLFYKLLQRSAPLYLVKILLNWYTKLFSRVRWKSFMSDEFRIACGVRQGGLLSPLLFCLYVDNILKKLSKYGCRMKDLPCGSFI